MRILVTRPFEDGEEIARQLAARGHQALLAPLLTVHVLDGEPLDLAGIQAMLITSANGARALARRSSRRDVPIFAVGPQSADIARQLGFLRVRNSEGDARALAEAVTSWTTPDAGVLLHAAGEEAGNALCERLAALGFQARRDILYRMEKAVELPVHVQQALHQGGVDAALFFSPQSAALFADCVGRAGLSTDRLIAICISTNTAAALKGLAFAETRVAAAPHQAALLACL